MRRPSLVFLAASGTTVAISAQAADRTSARQTGNLTAELLVAVEALSR